mmetsp:Transcript_5597/g.15178  ORF Transcript_5597/g.15178 Transcript_5597/m.15178 type:complete len:117 (-) Transcript_5597:128-478(-)
MLDDAVCITRYGYLVSSTSTECGYIESTADHQLSFQPLVGGDSSIGLAMEYWYSNQFKMLFRRRCVSSAPGSVLHIAGQTRSRGLFLFADVGSQSVASTQQRVRYGLRRARQRGHD